MLGKNALARALSFEDENDTIEEVVRQAAIVLGLLYLPSY